MKAAECAICGCDVGRHNHGGMGCECGYCTEFQLAAPPDPMQARLVAATERQTAALENIAGALWAGVFVAALNSPDGLPQATEGLLAQIESVATGHLWDRMAAIGMLGSDLAAKRSKPAPPATATDGGAE